MEIKKLINSLTGKYVMSILLGLGLSALFRKACTSKKCNILSFPSGKKVEGKTYKFNGECYNFTLEPSKCDPSKKIIHKVA
tara:strand:+ start:206 stop:448 length:243 start_codon:yes stop_codon:yes gene_type:complete